MTEKPESLQLPPDKVAKLVRYETLEGFVEGQNNFYFHFLPEGSFVGDIYKTQPHYRRFKALHPELDSSLKAKLSQRKVGSDAYKELFKAYAIMSELVSVDDPHVREDGKVNDQFLLR